tara:strand:- start:18129 stop:18890 length:762 start_codon:yes stop_codon:yes gene_type:complete
MSKNLFYTFPLERIDSAKEDLIKNGIAYIDNFLPKSEVLEIINQLPEDNKFKHFKTNYESKLICQLSREFNQKIVKLYSDLTNPKSEFVEKLKEIIDLKDIFTDSSNYAGGISLMKHNDFLSNHIDNSHDSHLKLYRRINILYYFSPHEWLKGFGGNLNIWPNGLKGSKYTIAPITNRMVIMLTNKNSFHGVDKVNSEIFRRYCISTYYYSTESQSGDNYYHPTTFRFPNNKIKDLISIGNSQLRSLYKFLKK